MTVGMLETKTAFAEVDLARDAGFLHPLQGAVDGGAADAMVLTLYESVQIVSTQFALLFEERVDDQVSFTGSLGAGWAQAIEIGNGRAGGHDPELSFLLRRER